MAINYQNNTIKSDKRKMDEGLQTKDIATFVRWLHIIRLKLKIKKKKTSVMRKILKL